LLAVTDGDDKAIAPVRRSIRGRRERGMRPSIRRPSDGRADEIVRVAAQLFRDNGYVRTSVADIAQAIGILPGSLYHYIDSKEDLLFAVVNRAHEDLIARVESQPLSGLAPVEALRLLVRIHIEEIARNLTFAIVSNTDARELEPRHREAIFEMRARYQRTIIDLVRRGQSDGTWCRRVDPVLASLTVTAIGNSLTGWYRPEEERWTVEAISELYAGMVVNALRCDHDPACDAG
jgi:AcrR family transcriptional regulator